MITVPQHSVSKLHARLAKAHAIAGESQTAAQKHTAAHIAKVKAKHASAAVDAAARAATRPTGS